VELNEMTSPDGTITISRTPARVSADDPIAAIARAIAWRWAASFGVDSTVALERLEFALTGLAYGQLAVQGGRVDFEQALDEAAYLTIAGWLEAVLGEPVAQSAQQLSAARLAFLAANADGSWSESFLVVDGGTADLRAAMEATRMMATPPVVPRHIERQSL
jgi:hypothetical protein